MTKTLRAASTMALLAIGCLLTHAPARAQSVYGSVFGTVTDKTGAVVPGATITVTDEAKGTVETAVSNDSGEFNVGHLVPDVYDVKVEVKGFKSFVTKGIAVQADTSPRIDVAMEVSGGGAETITVDADSVPVLKTDRADVSTVFNSQEVNDLPIGDQNFTNLQLLLPGAQLLGWSHAADENPQASKQIQIDGQAFGGVAYELDGTDNQDPILGIVVVNPSMDSITETKITTQNFDAELGKAVSAVMAVQTKSGSNSFHGSAYDFRTSNAFLAREPFSQGTQAAVPAGLKNKFGGSVGGRLIKDRFFFFGSYEGQRQKVGYSEIDTLPSKVLADSCLGTTTGPSGIPGCDFTQYLQNLPGGVNNPNGGAPQGQIFDNSSGTAVAYPGNTIPAAQVSQQFKNVLTALLPYINQEAGGGLGGLDGNYQASGGGGFNSDLWAVRFDDTISQKQNAFVRFSRWTNTLNGAQIYGAAGLGGRGLGLAGYGGASTSADDSVAAGTDYVFNPKLVMDLRLGYLRYNIGDQKNDGTAAAAAALGLVGENTSNTTTGGLPDFAIATLAGGGTQPLWGDGLNVSRCNCPLIEREDQFQIANNWTKTIGNHAFKVGADLRYGRNLRVPSDTNRTGVLGLNTGPTSNAGSGGLGFASFALGDVATYQRYVSTSTNAKEFQKRTFFYGQDTWRVTPKLTLNLGVRWEYYFPETVNGKEQGSLLDMRDGYLHVAGVGGIGTNMNWAANMKRQFEPRIGIAYQLNEKTVIRTGYGRSFDIGVFGSIFGHTATQNLPVLANQSLSNATNSLTGSAFCIGAPGDNPGCSNISTDAPAGGGPAPYVAPAVPTNGLLPNPGADVSSKARLNPLRFPTLDAWNLSFQRALTPTLSLTLAYVANKGTNTLSDGDGNSTNPNEAAIALPATTTAYGQTLSIPQSLHWDPRTAGSPGMTAGATGNQNALQRYYGGTLPACGGPCGWTQGIQLDGDDQNTNFNAMQVTVAQQSWKGLAMTANYQWASAFSEASGYATWSKRVAYGRDSNVRKSSATAYGSYQLPIGKGKMFMPGANRVEDILLGGFEVSSTFNRSSGLPFTPTINCKFDYIDGNGVTQTASDLPGSAPCYPQKISGRMPTKVTGFNTVTSQQTYFQAQTLGTIFSDAGLDQIGNNGRNTYWGPSFYNLDLSVQKTFAIWEKVGIKARADAYNALNHINPGNPSNVNVLSAGTINGEAPGPGPRQLEMSVKLTF
jgi:hypothetical protein